MSAIVASSQFGLFPENHLEIADLLIFSLQARSFMLTPFFFRSDITDQKRLTNADLSISRLYSFAILSDFVIDIPPHSTKIFLYRRRFMSNAVS